MIGIPTAAAVNPALGNSAAPGIGFAISADTAMRIADQLIASGKVTDSGRAALGVGVVGVVDQTGNPAGVGIASLEPNSPAAAAGLAVGDVITSINATPVSSPTDLARAMVQVKPGAQVPVGYTTPDGTRRTATVTATSLAG